MSYCARCGREAALSAGPDGGMYCGDCIHQISPQSMDCRSCAERYCGGVMACPFCTGCAGMETPAAFIENVKKPVIQPLRVDEKCERCGGTLSGRAFILHGKALCRDCLIYEQDRWEIVPAKPSKHGNRIRIMLERPQKPAGADDAEAARRLFHSIGVDPENPPPDPFAGAKTLGESKMPDNSCINCEAYAAGRKHAKFLGANEGDGKKKG
ncbi:hypothetical protein L0Y65_00115 [Candidatus Micrarchaeota archaeon]|nr:hypothetical protein [Candidatus Micrarchaeota archaeon]